jgi:hypothetical protein
MKTKVLILIFSVLVIVTLYRCQSCYPCLAIGESFKLPYDSVQIVSYTNDLQNRIEFTVNKHKSLPAEEFCGDAEMHSYNKCYGNSRTELKYNNDSSTLIIIDAKTPEGKGVEKYIYFVVTVVNAKISFGNNELSSEGLPSTAIKKDKININGIQYRDVYIYQNDSAGINNCSYFVYSTRKGVIKYIIRHELASENWILAN